MNQEQNQGLLENEQVVEEIKRHLWIESEKVGYDIGYDSAAEDWLSKYSADWKAVHMSQAKRKVLRQVPVKVKRTTTARKRKAKSYI